MCQKKSKYETHKKSFKTLLKNPNDRVDALQGGLFGFFNIHCCKTSKIEGGFGRKNIEKKSLNAKNTERGTLWDFSTSILSQSIKNIEGGPFEGKMEISLTILIKTEKVTL